MSVMSLLVLLLSGFFVCCSAQNSIQPANQHASAEARRVLDYLKRLYNHQVAITRDELSDWK